LSESEARFSSAAFQASPIFIAVSQMDKRPFRIGQRLVRELVGLLARGNPGRNALELGLWQHEEDRLTFWDDLRRTGFIREREYCFRNRPGGHSRS